ncbi:MAG: hypothetical protein IT369_05820 [Candidatus Latescibacteria bacterium]|nr:hypothetical protein [Candidatus Latescibacterota bacterium]
MVGLQLLPAILSLLVLGAHFLRAGNMAMLLLSLVMLCLLAVRRPWAARVVQAALFLGTAEWVRTLAGLAALRAEAGQPVLRMLLILVGVALVTGASALVFRSSRLRQWYGLGPVGEGEGR